MPDNPVDLLREWRDEEAAQPWLANRLDYILALAEQQQAENERLTEQVGEIVSAASDRGLYDGDDPDAALSCLTSEISGYYRMMWRITGYLNSGSARPDDVEAAVKAEIERLKLQVRDQAREWLHVDAARMMAIEDRDAAQAENERLNREVDEAEKRRDSAMVLVRLNLKLADECIDARDAAQADAARLTKALREARCWMRGDARTPAERGCKCETALEAYAMVDAALSGAAAPAKESVTDLPPHELLALASGLADIAAGRTRPLSEIRREIEADECGADENGECFNCANPPHVGLCRRKAKQDTPHAPTEAEAADLERPKEEA